MKDTNRRPMPYPRHPARDDFARIFERAARRFCALAALVGVLYVANGAPSPDSFNVTTHESAATVSR